MTFNTEDEWQEMGEAGWLKRIGLQYHWENDGYSTFEDYLAALKQSKRKNIRQERKSVLSQGLEIERLRGAAITPSIWNTFYEFYLNTTDRKWGSAYLTKDFFQHLGANLGDRVLLVVARDTTRGGELVAAALNLIGSHALFGRNWGCKYASAYKNLHFELCYYQAIEAAIEMGLPRVEAGAQGEHKLQRGYLPNTTYSCHYIRDPTARSVIQQFLHRESMQMSYTIDAMIEVASPFKQPPQANELAFAAVKAIAEQEIADTESHNGGESKQHASANNQSAGRPEGDAA